MRLSSSFEARVDASAFEAAVAGASAAFRRDAVAKACMAAARELRKAVEDELLAREPVGGSEVLRKTSRHWPAEALRKGGIGLERSYDGWGAAVSIAQSHADFRLHWMEGGTAERLTKSGARRGSVRGSGFFEAAVGQSGDAAVARVADALADLLREKGFS